MTLDVRQIVADPAKPKGQAQGRAGGRSRRVQAEMSKETWMFRCYKLLRVLGL